VFRESAEVLEQLRFTCDPINSCKNELPYIPLDQPNNLHAFLVIWQWIRKYQHGYYLNQSSTGLAGVLFITAALILFIVVGSFVPNLRPNLIGTVISVYYAILTTSI
jgi:hypothetical protein